jgi:hypothetical protein
VLAVSAVLAVHVIVLGLTGAGLLASERLEQLDRLVDGDAAVGDHAQDAGALVFGPAGVRCALGAGRGGVGCLGGVGHRGGSL